MISIIISIFNIILSLVLFKIWLDYRKLLKDHIKTTNDFANAQSNCNKNQTAWNERTSNRFNKYGDIYSIIQNQELSIDAYINSIAERKCNAEFQKRIEPFEEICRKDLDHAQERELIKVDYQKIKAKIKEEIAIKIIKNIVDAAADEKTN